MSGTGGSSPRIKGVDEPQEPQRLQPTPVEDEPTDLAGEIEMPVVARMVVEIRSDGTKTMARGALEDLVTGQQVAIETEPSVRAGVPRMLFEDPGLYRMNGRTYDVSPDGDRFLIAKSVEDEARSGEIVVVLNWFQELQNLNPTN